jgi:hypothetical protein
VLTEKQKAWDEYKDRWAIERRIPRGVAVTIPERRKVSASRCPDCPHAWKKHKLAGRCRKDCACMNGMHRRPTRAA